MYKFVIAALVVWKYLCGSCNSGCVVAVLAVLHVHVDAFLCNSTESNLATDVQLDILFSLRQ